jgi:hypothetical protein
VAYDKEQEIIPVGNTKAPCFYRIGEFLGQIEPFTPLPCRLSLDLFSKFFKHGRLRHWYNCCPAITGNCAKNPNKLQWICLRLRLVLEQI